MLAAMGHHLNAFIARPEALRRLASRAPWLRLVALPQGLALAPVPEERREMDDDDPGGPGAALQLPFALAEAARDASREGDPIGWIETDWFGGMGESRALLWQGGSWRGFDDVNPMLRDLGVVRVPEAVEQPDGRLARLVTRLGPPPPLLDEWDSIGLAGYRDTESVYERALPVAPGDGS